MWIRTDGLEAAIPLDRLEPFGNRNGKQGDVGPLKDREREIIGERRRGEETGGCEGGRGEGWKTREHGGEEEGGKSCGPRDGTPCESLVQSGCDLFRACVGSPLALQI